MPTTNLGITYIAQSQALKELTANVAFDVFDAAIAGVASKSVAGGTDVTLTATEARNAVLTFTGLLTANINVIVPTSNKLYVIYNNTTGAYTLTVKTAAGTGIAVTQGSYAILYCNATNVLQAVVAAAGGGTLSGLTAAAAANTIDNTDYAQQWQWKLTTTAKIGLQISEPTASTGTNAIMVQIDTLSTSSAIPLLVKARGTEVFRIPAGGGSIHATAGVGSTAPTYSFLSDTNTGMYSGGADILNFAVGGAILASLTISQLMVPTQNTTAAPGLAAYGLGGIGINMNTGTFQICLASLEHTMLANAAGLNSITSTQAAANATAFSRNYKKARGSVAFPTVITTGDDILLLNTSAYVGGTGLYVTCAQQKVTTEGTLADTTTGIGGVIVWSTMAVGSAIAERLRLDSKGNLVKGTAALATSATDGFIYIPTCAGAPSGVPTTYAGRAAMALDTTNKKIYWYNPASAAWEGVTIA